MMPTPLPQLQSVADEVVCVLHDRGPLDRAVVSAALGEDPDDEAWLEELDDAVDECDRLDELSDGRLADGVALLQRCTLTRRLTDAEAAGGHLELHGDLYPLVDLLGESVPLARGSRARVTIGREPGRAPTERLVGPPGWLEDARPGDLVGLRLADGLLHVSVRPTPSGPGAAAQALAAAARPYLEDSPFDPPRAGVRVILWDAAAAQPEAFDGVLPPLSEMVADVDLQLTETMLMGAEEDLHEAAPLGDLLANIAAQVRDGADDAVLDGVALLRDLTRALECGDELSSEQLAAAGEALADPDVVDVYLGQPAMREGAALLGAAVAAVASGPGRAAACYVQASAALAAGDMVAAERHVTEALHADPDLHPALVEAARIADIRGDAPAALRLLGRAGLDQSPRAERLRGSTTGTGAKVGRNDPCPCGSGRKSKRCCGDRPGGALPQRAPWLLEKVYDTVGGELLERRLTERLEAAGRLSDWVAEHARHPVVEDVALFELGLLEDFLDRWGPLLPEDERELARAWRDTRRGLYDVGAVRGHEVTLRDRADGAALTARHPGAAPPRNVTLLARLLPDGGGAWLLTSEVRVGDPGDPAVVRSTDPATDPLVVAEVWAAGRPVLSTTEDEPTVTCVWEAPLPAGAADLLAEALRERGLEEDDPGVFAELAEVDGQLRLRGTVTVTEDMVRIDTNAERRLDRLTGYVQDAVGDLEPAVDRRTPLWRAMDDERRFGVLRPPPEPTAEERDAVERLLREQERRWLDEPVPALGGLTPREAREHPTGRAALDALLASFDDRAGGLDSDRLRVLLDLPVRGGATRAAAPAADRAQARKAARARRAFAFPRLEGEWDGIDVAELDPADEDDRWLLVEAEHELEDRWAPDDPFHGPGGEHQAHYTMHTAVASQLFEDDPPQLWPTAERLLTHGYDRHEVLHMLASAFAAQLWLDRTEERGFDLGAYVERLEALPETWEQTRLEGGGGRPRGGRRPPSGHSR